MRALLDTSVLIGADAPGELEGAISAASLAELHFGVLVAPDPDERARRALRLGVIEATFDPLPIDAAVAREWGRLAAAVRTPRRPAPPTRARPRDRRDRQRPRRPAAHPQREPTSSSSTTSSTSALPSSARPARARGERRAGAAAPPRPANASGRRDENPAGDLSVALPEGHLAGEERVVRRRLHVAVDVERPRP